MPGDVSHLSPTVSALFRGEQLIAEEATRLHLSLVHANPKKSLLFTPRNIWYNDAEVYFHRYM